MRVAFALMALSLLSACGAHRFEDRSVVGPEESAPPAPASGESAGVPRAVVTTPPPEVPVEETPPPPDVRAVWIPGYWYWTGRDYAWVPGRWGNPPAPGHIWVRSGWLVVNGGYTYAPGYWAPSYYQPRRRYYRQYPPRTRGPVYRTRRRRR